jgi:hypothetical protein
MVGYVALEDADFNWRRWGLRCRLQLPDLYQRSSLSRELSFLLRDLRASAF